MPTDGHPWFLGFLLSTAIVSISCWSPTPSRRCFCSRFIRIDDPHTRHRCSATGKVNWTLHTGRLLLLMYNQPYSIYHCSWAITKRGLCYIHISTSPHTPGPHAPISFLFSTYTQGSWHFAEELSSLTKWHPPVFFFRFTDIIQRPTNDPLPISHFLNSEFHYINLHTPFAPHPTFLSCQNKYTPPPFLLSHNHNPCGRNHPSNISDEL